MLFDNGLYRPEGALIPTGSLYTAGPYQVGECFPRGSAGDYFLVYRLNYERRSRAPEVSGGLSRTEAQRGGRFLLGRTTKHGSTFVSPCLIPQRGNKVAQWSASPLSTPGLTVCTSHLKSLRNVFNLPCVIASGLMLHFHDP